MAAAVIMAMTMMVAVIVMTSASVTATRAMPGRRCKTFFQAYDAESTAVSRIHLKPPQERYEQNIVKDPRGWAELCAREGMQYEGIVRDMSRRSVRSISDL